jgi:hypothetical protein
MTMNAQCRCILITAYEDLPKRLDRLHVYLDPNEVEAISAPQVGPYTYWVFMKSGKTWQTNEESFNLIEQAMQERER